MRSAPPPAYQETISSYRAQPSSLDEESTTLLKDRRSNNNAQRIWPYIATLLVTIILIYLWKELKEEKGKLSVQFASPQPDKQCTSYGTREYSSRLLNVPDTMDGIRICMETTARIHGVALEPNYCENRGNGEGVWGHWVVDFKESACSPQFTNFQDKGCLTKGSRTRVFHAHLDGLQPGDDWRIMCSTTPARFFDYQYDSPTRCDWFGFSGVWGIWEVPDNSC